MKLSQNSTFNHAGESSEFTQFKRSLGRQAVSFGMMSGVDSHYGNCVNGIHHDKQRAPLSSAFRTTGAIGNLALVVKNWWQSQSEKAAIRNREKGEVKELLQMSDYQLRDIGLHRGDLEMIAITGASLETLTREFPLDLVTQNGQPTPPGLAVIQCGSKNEDSAEHATAFDQAA